MSGAALLIHDAKQLRLTFTCWLRRQTSLTRAGQPRLSQRNKYERTNESQINIVSCKCWQHNARLTQLQSPQLPISSLCVPSSTYNKGSSHAVSYSVRRRADFWNIYYSIDCLCAALLLLFSLPSSGYRPDVFVSRPTYLYTGRVSFRATKSSYRWQNCTQLNCSNAAVRHKH